MTQTLPALLAYRIARLGSAEAFAFNPELSRTNEPQTLGQFVIANTQAQKLKSPSEQHRMDNSHATHVMRVLVNGLWKPQTWESSAIDYSGLSGTLHTPMYEGKSSFEKLGVGAYRADGSIDPIVYQAIISQLQGELEALLAEKSKMGFDPNLRHPATSTPIWPEYGEIRM